MNKKLVLIICAISAILVTAVLVVFLKLKSGVFTSPVSKVQPTPVVVEETAAWTDPAQFSFNYPKTLMLNSHDEDQENYAHVELTSATHSGNLVVWAKDTTADTIDSWITAKKISGAIDSSLGDVPAKKVLDTSDTNKLTISAIQRGYLYQIEANLVDQDFWSKTLDTVISSFKFTTSSESAGQKQDSRVSTNQGADTGGGDEEVIE